MPQRWYRYMGPFQAAQVNDEMVQQGQDIKLDDDFAEALNQKGFHKFALVRELEKEEQETKSE